jgi:hypothetical protein
MPPNGNYRLPHATIGGVSHRDPNDFLEKSRQRQRNLVFPDTVRNVRSVDAFLWRGSPNPTRVQRVGAWLFGITFIGLGACLITFVGAARSDGEWVGAFVLASMSVGAIALGIRIFLNGFPRRKS